MDALAPSPPPHPPRSCTKARNETDQIKPPNGRFAVLLSTGREGPPLRHSSSETWCDRVCSSVQIAPLAMAELLCPPLSTGKCRGGAVSMTLSTLGGTVSGGDKFD